MQVVDQKMERKTNSDRCTKNPQTTSQIPNNTNTFQHRSMKIDVPCFDVDDVSGWIFKIAQFFQYYNTTKDQRILISSFNLEGPALS